MLDDESGLCESCVDAAHRQWVVALAWVGRAAHFTSTSDERKRSRQMGAAAGTQFGVLGGAAY